VIGRRGQEQVGSGHGVFVLPMGGGTDSAVRGEPARYLQASQGVGTGGLVSRARGTGRTTLTQTMLYASREARDIALKSDMDEGMAMGYDRLAQQLAQAQAGGSSARRAPK
jgi:hypothetical protein